MKTLAVAWFWSLLADVVGKLAPALTILAYYRYFGGEKVANIVVAYSYVLAAWTLVDLGLGLYGSREVAAKTESAIKLKFEITIARLSIFLPIGFALSAALLFALQLSVPQTVLFVCYLLSRTLSLDWLLRGQERFKDYSTITQLSLVGQLCGLAIVLNSGAFGLQIAPLPFLCSGVVIASLTWIKSGGSCKKLSSFSLRLALSHVLRSYELSLVNGVSVITQQMPLIFLSLIAPVSSFASFALLHRLVLSATTLFVSFGAVFFPRLVRSAKLSLRKAFSEMLRFGVIVFFCAIFITALLASIVMTEYVQKVYFSRVDLPLFIAMGIYFVLRSARIAPMRFLIAAEMNRQAMLVTMIAFVVSGLGLVSFIYVGHLTQFTAALVFTIVELLTVVAMMFQSWRLAARLR